MPKVVIFPHEAKKTEFQQLKAHFKRTTIFIYTETAFFSRLGSKEILSYETRERQS